MCAKQYFSVALMFLLSMLPFQAKAAIQLFDQEISALGSHTGQTIFMYLTSTALADNGCSYAVLYCPSSNPDCKNMLSIALAARAMHAKIYVAFEKDPATNNCNLSHIKF